MVSQGLSLTLNQLRWVSAWLVVVSHIRPMMLVDFSQVTEHRWLWSGVYLLSSLGREAVVVFFVVSGFLVGGLSVNGWLTKGHFSPGAFALARVSRIHTVLLPALLLGWCLDHAGHAVWSVGGLYDGATRVSHIQSLPEGVMLVDGFGAFLRNALLLQGITGPTFGSNGPLWSLAYEWWYYVLCALVLTALSRSGVWRWASVAAAVVAGLWLPGAIWAAAPQWLMGLALGLALPRIRWRPSRWLAGAALLGALALCRYLALRGGEEAWSVWATSWRHGVLAVAVALWLWAHSGNEHTWIPAARQRLHKRLAAFSYSLYLSHFPLVMALLSVLHVLGVQWVWQQPGAGAALAMVTMFVGCLMWGDLMGRVFERRTHWVRQTLSRWAPWVGAGVPVR